MEKLKWCKCVALVGVFSVFCLFRWSRIFLPRGVVLIVIPTVISLHQHHKPEVFPTNPCPEFAGKVRIKVWRARLSSWVNVTDYMPFMYILQFTGSQSSEARKFYNSRIKLNSYLSNFHSVFSPSSSVPNLLWFCALQFENHGCNHMQKYFVCML